MKLYFHTDRAGRLREGDIIENKVYPSGTSLSLLYPMIDREFHSYINCLYAEGISYHGYNYLVGCINNKMDFTSWATEMYFEYIRFKHYPDMPSRFQSLFGWGDIENALAFRKASGDNGAIFEIESDGRIFAADMELLKLSFDTNTQAGNAGKYWTGKPYKSDIDYSPKWEYLISTPVKVIRQVI